MEQRKNSIAWMEEIPDHPRGPRALRDGPRADRPAARHRIPSSAWNLRRGSSRAASTSSSDVSRSGSRIPLL